MAYSDQQIADYAHQLEAKGAKSQEIETFVKAAKQEQTAAGIGSYNKWNLLGDVASGAGKVAIAYGKDHPAPPPPEPTALENMGRGIQEMGANAVSQFAKGTGNLIQAGGELLDTINPVNVFSKVTGIGKPTDVAQMITKPIQQAANWVGDKPLEVQRQLGLNPDSAAGKVGGFLGDVAAQVPAMIGGGELLSHVKNLPKIAEASKAYPTIAKALGFAAESAGSTGIIKGETEGTLPSLTELGGYGLLDLLTLGASKAGSSLYKSAFKGTKGQEKALLNSFENTVGDVAEQLGYTGSSKQIAEQAGSKANTIFSQIAEKAKTGGEVTRDQFMGLKQELVKPFEKLPDSQFKKEAMQAVNDVVDLYAPTTKASGDQLVEIITNINRGLFGDGQRVVLSPKQVSSLTNQLKSGIKDFLPEGIRPLYEQFAKNKLIENVMKDAEVKRLMGRTIVGGGTGAVTGAVTGLADPNGDKNWQDIVTKALVGAITGALVGRSTGNTYISTKAGSALKKAASPAFNTVVKNVTKQFVDFLNPQQKE